MSTPRTSVKMAALAPMPSASVMTATAVNPGDLRSWRRANFMSFISFSSQSDDRIDARSAAGGYQACDQSGEGQRCGGDDNQQRIVRRHLVQLSGDEMSRAKC